MGVLRTVGIFGLGIGVTLLSVRAHSPETADAVTSDMASTGGQMFQGAGYVAGEALRSTGPVMAGGKDALQQSGIGTMLTPDTIPAATQPDPAP